jgi:hypothetical protein
VAPWRGTSQGHEREIGEQRDRPGRHPDHIADCESEEDEGHDRRAPPDSSVVDGFVQGIVRGTQVKRAPVADVADGDRGE